MFRPIVSRAGRLVLATGYVCVVAASLSACGNDTDGVRDGGSCAAQVVTVDPATVRLGAEVTLHGTYYVNGCGDVVEQADESSKSEPMKSVLLTLKTADGTARDIAKLDANGSLGEIDYVMTIPKDLPEGTTVIRLGDADPVSISVTR